MQKKKRKKERKKVKQNKTKKKTICKMFCYIPNLTSISINVNNDLCEIMIAWNWKYCDKTFFFAWWPYKGISSCVTFAFFSYWPNLILI